MDEKRCGKCGLTKPVSEFGRNRKQRDGYSGGCKPCHASWTRKSRYGLDDEKWEAILRAQGGLCAICRLAPATHIDHDHACCQWTAARRTCGRCVRGVLCRKCNVALGIVGDSLEIVERMHEYLRDNRQQR